MTINTQETSLIALGQPRGLYKGQVLKLEVTVIKTRAMFKWSKE